jgi:osmotically-inducible protein OsmY
MKTINSSLIATLLIGTSLLGVSTLAACTTSTPREETAGQYLDSSAITGKVKAKLLTDDRIKSFDITVNTYQNVVQLSGFVNSQRQKAKAEELARSVQGVRGVQNDLLVK